MCDVPPFKSHLHRLILPTAPVWKTKRSSDYFYTHWMILLRTHLCLPGSELSHTAHVILHFFNSVACLYFFIITQHLFIKLPLFSVSSDGLCQARNSLPCVTPTGLSFISQSRWASVFNESHAQIFFRVLTFCPVFFLILQSRSEIKNGTILRLAISPVSALCLLLFYSVCVTVAPGSICGLPLENIPAF